MNAEGIRFCTLPAINYDLFFPLTIYLTYRKMVNGNLKCVHLSLCGPSFFLFILTKISFVVNCQDSGGHCANYKNGVEADAVL